MLLAKTLLISIHNIYFSGDMSNSYRMVCTCKKSVQPAYQHSLIRIFPVCILDSQGCKVSSRGQQRLIRLSGCTGWSEASLVTQVILKELLCYDKSLWKQAYSNILRILPPKNENFQVKNSGSFHISAQNVDCRYLLELPQWGSSNKYPQFMFLSRNKKINVYLCKPQFYCTKVGFKGSKLYRHVFVMNKYLSGYISHLEQCLLVQ